MAASERIPKSAWLILALLMLSAGILRFTQLDSAPAGGQGDVSWVGINALDWVDRGIAPFYVRELYAPEFFPVYITGLLLPITGISQLPQRIMTAASGVLLVFCLFWATWWLLASFAGRRRRWSALAAAAAGALSIHVTYLTRLGMESPPFLLTVTLFVGAVAWAWERGGIRRWALAGLILGINQYIYLPARLLPVVLALWLGYALLLHRDRFRQHLRGVVVAALLALLVALPAILLFLQTPEAFSARADAGTQETGGWVWLYDTAQYGGVIGLIAQKLWLTLVGIGVTWSAEYTLMGQPMLPPLFFAGFIAAVLLTFRCRKSTAFAWCWLAIPPLLLTDVISGGVPRVHALHQMGILPFILILSGIGLGFTGDRLASLIHARLMRAVLFAALAAAAALIPSALGFARYLDEYVPAQYRDPQFYWSKAQADLDIARYLTAHRDQTYLLPVSEYTRSDLAWFLAAGFRARRSAIDADGRLNLPPLPDQITVVMPADPERPRHDGHPAHFNLDQWVLLHDNVIYLLPMLTDDLSVPLAGGAPLIDRSGTEIARFVVIDRPDFSTQTVIEHPLDATFGNSVKLVGYSARHQDIAPGDFVDLTLYFQSLKPIPEDYEVFAQLWSDAQVSVAHTHEFPYGGMYRSRIWDTGEIVPVHLWLQVPDDLAYGRYTLVIGLFRILANERLPVSGPNAVPDDGIASARDFRYPLPSDAVDTSGAPSITFGDTLRQSLVSAQANGAPLSGDVWDVPPGASLNLGVVWQALQRPAQDESVFLHLTAADNQPPLAQTDALIRADYPTGVWRASDQFAETLSLTLPANLEAGEYDLVTGVYNWQSGERLTVSPGDRDLPDNRVRLARIRVG